MLITNSLHERLTACKSNVRPLNIFRLTLQLFHRKLPQQWCLNLFKIQFQRSLTRKMIVIHLKKINVQKIIYPIFHKSRSENQKVSHYRSVHICYSQTFGLLKFLEFNLGNSINLNSEMLSANSDNLLLKTLYTDIFLHTSEIYKFQYFETSFWLRFWL